MFKFFKNKNILFCVLIINLQISFISSNFEKCYSIANCLRCPELDICDECKSGFLLNKPKTKCNGNEKEKDDDEDNKKQTPKTPVTPKPPEIKKNDNPFLNKAAISVNKAPNNPFQNIPVSSLQRFKDRVANNEIINKILIFILIILVLSIVASVIYNFIKKKIGKGYNDEDGQEESAKVVYIR